MASHPIYRFYAELQDYQPKIWRRFQLTNNITMARLAYILMTLFEMQASHLFCFDVPYAENYIRGLKKEFPDNDFLKVLKDKDFLSSVTRNLHIEIPDEDDYGPQQRDVKLLDARSTLVKDAVYSPEDRMVFTYDFGDGWEILLILEEEVLIKELPAKELPRVLAGEGYGIIEDCGGACGLAEIAKAFKRKKGPQYLEYKQWLGRDELDLGTFDMDDINFRVKKVPRIYADIYEYDLEPTKRSMDLLERKYLR